MATYARFGNFNRTQNNARVILKYLSHFPNAYLVVDPEHVGYVDSDLDDVDLVDEGQLELGVGRRQAEVPVAAPLAVVGRRRGRRRLRVPRPPKTALQCWRYKL